VRRWVLLALVLLAFVLVMNAWACDDAFITFRTVRNLWAGHGLTWNPGWRVQAYTHPLWMFITAAGYGISGECYFSVIGISLALSLGAAVALARSNREYGAVGVILFSASAAAIEFAVSGLENPLLFLLLIAFVGTRHALGAALLAAAVGLTRTDALLLVLPALALHWRAWRQLALGLTPLLAWHVFSLVYYGIPYPNTALAKLHVDWPTTRVLAQGCAYLLDSLQRDPLTLLTIAGSLALLRRHRAYALGVMVYLAYVVRIGGDFMSGRFLGAPFVFALAAVFAADVIPPVRWRLPAVAGIVLFASAWPHSPWHFQLDRGPGMTVAEATRDGIADERGFYYRQTGLLHVLLDLEVIEHEGLPIPPHFWAQEGRAIARSKALLGIHGAVGFYGYFIGDKHVVDENGLADPFLARIPHCINPFRIGHCARKYPPGYIDTLVRGRNQLHDRELALLYDRVHALAVEPLFAPERWRAIACLNVGLCNP
jgi:arabinofuranosyltransferase